MDMKDRDETSSSPDLGVSEIHSTEDGPIHLWVSPDKEGGWKARIWGTQLAGARSFKTVEAANTYALDSFRQMFPEHTCTDRCGTSAAVAQKQAADEMNAGDY